MSTALSVVITDAGIAEVINAEQTGTAPVVLTHIAFGTGQYVPQPSRTALQNEFKRMSAVAGGGVGDNTIHLTINDSSADAYTVYEVGVFTSSGTLFAVYSQTTPIVQKASAAQTLLAIDFVLTNINPDNVTVGDTTYVLAPATTIRLGMVELATNDETITGSDASRAVTPASLTSRTATTGRTGLVELATNTETLAGIDGARAVTPASLVAAFVREHITTGMQKMPGGFMLQWGRALIAPDGTTRIAFSTAFPTAGVFAGAFSMDAVQPSFSIATLAAGTVNFRHNGNGGVNSVWFAIGY